MMTKISTTAYIRTVHKTSTVNLQLEKLCHGILTRYVRDDFKLVHQLEQRSERSHRLHISSISPAVLRIPAVSRLRWCSG